MHLFLDDLSTHKTPAAKAWFPRHKRFVFHFTPTSASWKSLIEAWFSVLTRQAIRRDTFGSVHDLTHAIDAFADTWNGSAAPIVWVKTADQIIAEAVKETKGNTDAGH